MSYETNPQKFWLSDPAVLIRDPTFVVTTSPVQRLNVLTRWLLVGAAVLWAMGYKHAFTILGFGILMIIFMSYRHQCETFSAHRGNVSPCGGCGYDSNTSMINAKYEVTPELQFNSDNASKRSYANAKYEVIPYHIAAPYREIWRNESNSTNPYSMIPDPYTVSPGATEQEEPKSQCHYISRSSIDNVAGVETNGGLVSIRPAVESAFMRDTLEFRNGIMGEHADRFMRERQHGCSDIRPGRKTF